MITKPEELTALYAQWSRAQYLALDTEFIRTDTLFAKPGLIQIADLQGVYLLDPLTLPDLSGLVQILENPDIIKIMHAPGEDIDLLFHMLGARINRVFDTQVAAAFAGLAVSMGYQNLVMQVLSVPLDKGETRSDWLQRPLTDSQLAYAALDVIYLLKLYEALNLTLENNGYLAAMYEETQFQIEQTYHQYDHPELAYLKLRAAWELPEVSQKLLQALVMWRDKTAFSEDIPKPWVFNDATLIELVTRRPESANEIRRIKGVSGKSIKYFGASVLAEIAAFEADSAPFTLIDASLKPNEMGVYKKLKALVNEVSKQSGIPVQLLGSRKLLEMLVIHFVRKKHEQFPVEYQGWRFPLLADRLLQILKG